MRRTSIESTASTNSDAGSPPLLPASAPPPTSASHRAAPAPAPPTVLASAAPMRAPRLLLHTAASLLPSASRAVRSAVLPPRLLPQSDRSPLGAMSSACGRSSGLTGRLAARRACALAGAAGRTMPGMGSIGPGAEALRCSRDGVRANVKASTAGLICRAAAARGVWASARACLESGRRAASSDSASRLSRWDATPTYLRAAVSAQVTRLPGGGGGNGGGGVGQSCGHRPRTVRRSFPFHKHNVFDKTSWHT